MGVGVLLFFDRRIFLLVSSFWLKFSCGEILGQYNDRIDTTEESEQCIGSLVFTF